jgi:hypothetical protein
VLAQHSSYDHIDFPGFLGLCSALVQRMKAKLEEAVSVLFTKPQRRGTAATQRLCRCAFVTLSLRFFVCIGNCVTLGLGRWLSPLVPRRYDHTVHANSATSAY